MNRTQTPSDIAEIFDVHLKTVHGWIKDGCPHTKSSRTYKLNDGEVQAWVSQTGRSTKPGRPPKEPKAEAEDNGLGGDKDYWLARKYRTQCLHDEGELVPVGDVESLGAEIISMFQRRIVGGGSVLAVQLEGRDAGERQEIIERWHGELLADLAQGFRAMGERCRSAQKVHAERVG